MDVEGLDLSPLDLLGRWVMLAMAFYFLVYLFRDRIVLEGILGFCLPLLVLMPMNLLSQEWVPMVHSDVDPRLILVSILLAVNLVVLLLFNSLTSGLSTSGYLALALFAMVFSATAVGILMIPPLGDLPIMQIPEY